MTPDIVDRIIAEVPINFHVSGSLNPPVLRRIADLHRESGVKVSAETGCGATTLILSHLSERHTSFTVDAGDSLPNTRNHQFFNAATTNFVINPTQISLPRWSFDEPFDLVILDGPHAYPFPDLEYFFFYPHVKNGGILIVDDFHIPTIGRLRDFLCDDEMWEHLDDVETTAFFKRTTAPALSPYGDGWPKQRYNRRYFANPAALDGLFGENWRAREFGSETTEKLQEATYCQTDQHRARNERLEMAQRAVEMEKDLAAMRNENTRLKTSLAEMKASTSRRVTAPLRRIKSAVRGLA